MAERQRGRRRASANAATQRTAAAGVLLTLGACVGLPRIQQAAADYHRGQFATAASLFRDAIAAGDKSSRTLYNYGTALVAGDSLNPAKDALGRVTTDKDPDVRYRALLNLGLAHLKGGLRAPAGQGGDALDSALSVYKTAILQHPDDVDAKWNATKLALRQKPRVAGAVGVAAEDSPTRPTPSPQSQAPQPVRGAGVQQADQILGRRGARGRRCRPSSRNRTASNLHPAERTGDRTHRRGGATIAIAHAPGSPRWPACHRGLPLP